MRDGRASGQAAEAERGGRSRGRSSGTRQGSGGGGALRRRRALPWPFDGPIQRPFFFG